MGVDTLYPNLATNPNNEADSLITGVLYGGNQASPFSSYAPATATQVVVNNNEQGYTGFEFGAQKDDQAFVIENPPETPYHLHHDEGTQLIEPVSTVSATTSSVTRCNPCCAAFCVCGSGITGLITAICYLIALVLLLAFLVCIWFLFNPYYFALSTDFQNSIPYNTTTLLPGNFNTTQDQDTFLVRFDNADLPDDSNAQVSLCLHYNITSGASLTAFARFAAYPSTNQEDLNSNNEFQFSTSIVQNCTQITNMSVCDSNWPLYITVVNNNPCTTTEDCPNVDYQIEIELTECENCKCNSFAGLSLLIFIACIISGFFFLIFCCLGIIFTICTLMICFGSRPTHTESVQTYRIDQGNYEAI